MKNISLLALASATLLLASCGHKPRQPQPDTARPGITLTASPTTVTSAGTVTLRAAATDDHGVVGVTFYRGSTKLGEDTAAPYTMADTVTSAQNGSVTYRAVASDAAGNIAEASASVTVNIAQPGGGGTTPAPVVSVMETIRELVIDGQTMTYGSKAWTGGVGRVTLQVADRDEQGGRSPVLAEGALAADGRFTLNLPQTVADAHLSPLIGSTTDGGCTVSVSANARGSFALLNVVADKGGALQPFAAVLTRDAGGTPQGLTLNAGHLFYVDRDVTLTGNCPGSSDAPSTVLDWKMTKGWNRVNMMVVATLQGRAQSISLTQTGFPNEWLYLDASAAQSIPVPSDYVFSR